MSIPRFVRRAWTAWSPSSTQPKLSVVLISHNMRREIPRTLYSLSVPYQRNIECDEYEVILVDNGSAQPWTNQDFEGIHANIRIINLGADAKPSPAAAINLGLREARGELIGVMIDGARMVSPGLLHASVSAGRIYPRTVVATLGFHLGRELQSIAVHNGYNQAVEDRLLASINWPEDGYRLFDISVFAASSENGWFQPISESNALFLSKFLWDELGGFDERFESAGGGLVNLDIYERALALPEVHVVHVLGDGSFHQVHGGISTNALVSRHGEWMAEYQRIRGREYRRPTLLPEFFGSLPAFAKPCPADRGIARDYVELLKKALLNETNLDLEAAYLKTRSEIGGAGSGRELCDWRAKLEEGRRIGRFVDRTFENMPQCYTLIGRTRMDNLQSCVETVLEQGIPGDLIECGVWKGGACIFLRGILKAYRSRDRKVWVADSFCGVPAPAASDDGLDLSRSTLPQLAISLEQVKSNFEVFSLLDDQVQFLPGWFSDTLPAARIDRIAVLRLDGDLFSSTMDTLTSLYDKVSPGGFIIVDDYGVLPQCARAVEEFRAARQVTTPMETIDWSGVFWRKEP